MIGEEAIYQFTVPERFRGLLEAGKLIRRGALLIDRSSGGIVAHLQETGALAKVAASVWNPLGLVVNMATGVVNTVQNEQIKRRLDAMQRSLGVIQSLQIANLVGNVASIGVSAAGTMLVLRRIEKVRAGIAELKEDIHAFREEWRMAELLNLLDLATTHMGRVADAMVSNNREGMLRDAERSLHEVYGALSRRGKDLTSRSEIPTTVLMTVIEGMTASGDARTRALFMLNDSGPAKRFAGERMKDHVGIARSAPQDLLARRLKGEEDAGLMAKNFSSWMNETRMRIASVPPLLATLEAAGETPSGFLDASAAETEAPLMFLAASKT